MKKNKLFLFLMVAMMFLFAACGSKTETAETTPATEPAAEVETEVPVETEETTTEVTGEPEKTVYPDFLPWAYRVPDHNIYVNVPNWKDIEQGYVKEFVIYEEQMITVLGHRASSATTLEEAQADCMEEWMYCQDKVTANAFTVTSDEYGNMNGIDYYRYEGIWDCGELNKFTAYAVGYTFFMDGIPVNIQGIVLDPSQPQEIIDNITMITDEAMKTVRDAE